METRILQIWIQDPNMTGGPLKPDFGLSGDEAAWPLRTLGLVRPAFYAN